MSADDNATAQVETQEQELECASRPSKTKRKLFSKNPPDTVSMTLPPAAPAQTLTTQKRPTSKDHRSQTRQHVSEVLDLTQDSPVKRAAPVTETERHPVHSALGANFRVMELPEHEENAIPNLSLSPTNKCVVCNTSLAGLNLDERQSHTNDCLDAAGALPIRYVTGPVCSCSCSDQLTAFSPQIAGDDQYICVTCGKDLTLYNAMRRAQHVTRCVHDPLSNNRCAEPAVNSETAAQNSNERNGILGLSYACVICATDLSMAAVDRRIKHMRECGRKHSITPNRMRELQQINHVEKSPDAGAMRALAAKFSQQPPKSKHIPGPKTRQKEQEELAMALSESEQSLTAQAPQKPAQIPIMVVADETQSTPSMPKSSLGQRSDPPVATSSLWDLQQGEIYDLSQRDSRTRVLDDWEIPKVSSLSRSNGTTVSISGVDILASMIDREDALEDQFTQIQYHHQNKSDAPVLAIDDMLTPSQTIYNHVPTDINVPRNVNLSFDTAKKITELQEQELNEYLDGHDHVDEFISSLTRKYGDMEGDEVPVHGESPVPAEAPCELSNPQQPVVARDEIHNSSIYRVRRLLGSYRENYEASRTTFLNIVAAAREQFHRRIAVLRQQRDAELQKLLSQSGISSATFLKSVADLMGVDEEEFIEPAVVAPTGEHEVIPDAARSPSVDDPLIAGETIAPSPLKRPKTGMDMNFPFSQFKFAPQQAGPKPAFAEMTIDELKSVADSFGLKAAPKKLLVAQLDRIWNAQHGIMSPRSMIAKQLQNSNPRQPIQSSLLSAIAPPIRNSTMADKHSAIKPRIAAAIKSTPALYEQILAYETIDLLDAQEILKDSGHKFAKSALSEFFVEKGISFISHKKRKVLGEHNK